MFRRQARLISFPAVFVAAIVALAGLSGCGEDMSERSDVPSPVVTVTASPEATTSMPTPAAEAAKHNRPKPKPDAPVAPTYVMPDEIGKGLQRAQQDVKSILGVPVWPLLQSHDVLEGWRFQVLDADWQVCDQTPAPGASFDESTNIDFGVVKLDEKCPQVQ